MKKINYYLGAFALAAMTLASCSSDEPMKGIDPGKVDVDQVRYLNVTIASPNVGSRADEDPGFKDATTAENFVKDMFFVFYDANGDVLYSSQVSNKNDEFDKQPANGSVDKIWQSTVPVELSAGQNMPAYVMAFINPVNPAPLRTTSLSGLDEITRTQVVNGDGNFPMSNSVYYGTNPITGQDNVRMVATPITTAQLYTTEDAAKAADAKSVEIYVERYASRIDLTLATPTTTIVDNTDGVEGWTLKFVPEYWRPNAIDVNTYVVKHYAIQDDNGLNTTPSFTELNNLLNWNWNAADNFRSYWACSPSYYDAKYPKVSDDITDNGAGTYNLHYFSYNEIKDSEIDGVKQSSSMKYDNGFTGSFYARESTAAASAWRDAKEYNPAAVVTSAVIVGRYVITKNGEAAQPANTTFYLYGKTGTKYNLYLTENDVMNAILANQITVLDEKTHQPITAIPEDTPNPFKIEHPSKEVRDQANATVAGRFVALQMDNENPATGYVYFDGTTNQYVSITAANVKEVNAKLLTYGYARMYGGGLAYFSIPIQHLGFPEVGATKDGLLDYANCGAGSFGLVRNHLYTINITKISGLATALRDENQPIVPPMDEQTYYISAKLNVLNWRLVPVQEVEL